MPMRRHEPFGINRFFDDSIWPDRFFPSRLLSRMENAFPKVDITETDTEVKVTADVPGIPTENIDIDVEGDRMILKGSFEKEKTSDGEKPYRYERESGSFRREFMLPAHVKMDQARASCKDGVLTVTLPKSDDAKRQKIKIEKM